MARMDAIVSEKRFIDIDPKSIQSIDCRLLRRRTHDWSGTDSGIKALKF